MKPRSRVRTIDLMVALGIVLFCAQKALNRPHGRTVAPPAFAQQVQLDPLYETAVQADGRLRSFESHAKAYMSYVSGPRSIRGQSNGFTYLDLMFRPEQYNDVDLIYVKNKNVRARILEALSGHPEVDDARADAIMNSGLISRTLLSQPEVTTLLHQFAQDLIRTSKAVNAIQSALAVSDAQTLKDGLRVVAPPSGNVNGPWLSMARLVGPGMAPEDDIHAGMRSAAPVPGLDPTIQRELSGVWSNLQSAWLAEDAVKVNEQLAKLAGMVRTVSPQLYPASGRLAMESWYFRSQSMTWVWFFYLASVVPLLMSVAYQWDGARRAGMILFVVAFLFHTVSLGIRWYISGRWPNANMFEAVTTSAWFGGVAAMVLEWITRRTPYRNLFALGSAVMSMAALMAAYFLPAQLDSTINNKMAALNDVWLYIHTNMIIWSYAVIGLACVPALLQLRRRWCLAWDERTIPKARLLLLPVALVTLNGTGCMLLMHILDDPARELTGQGLVATIGAFWASMMIVALELNAAKERRATSVGIVERSASGGAAALMSAGSSGDSFLKPERPSLGQVLDGATMVLVELAFIMLWTGTVMGAIWADHSWGRPWGWDPKEVFALNTFIIFLILIHVRLKVRDKAFWTAVLAVVGFQVMMFNWIVVNFVITGLHSYA